MFDLNQAYLDLHARIDANVSPGVEVVKAEQRAPRPAQTYITIKVLPLNRQEGLSAEFYVGDDVSDEALFELDVILTSFGVDAHQELQNLRMHMLSVDTIEHLNSKGMALKDVSGLVDLTALMDTDFEQRAAFTAMYYVVDTTLTVDAGLNVIESVDIQDAEFEDLGGDLITTVDILVEKP